MIALAEPVSSTDSEVCLLKAKFAQQVRKEAERRIDKLGYTRARRVERAFEARMEEILSNAAQECLAALDEVIAEGS